MHIAWREVTVQQLHNAAASSAVIFFLSYDSLQQFNSGTRMQLRNTGPVTYPHRSASKQRCRLKRQPCRLSTRRSRIALKAVARIDFALPPLWPYQYTRVLPYDYHHSRLSDINVCMFERTHKAMAGDNRAATDQYGG